jgi:uncharacterized tellurite resistance protein B-like protein
MQPSIEQSKLIFSLLLELHRIDRSIDDSEIQYMKDVAHNLGLSKEDISELIGLSSDFKFTPPAKEEERMRILYYLLFGMRIDGQIKDNEKRYVTAIGLKLGFNELMINEMIQVLCQNLNEKIDDLALISIIKKYLN